MAASEIQGMNPTFSPMVKPSVVGTQPRGSPCISIAQTFIMWAPVDGYNQEKHEWDGSQIP